MASPVKDGISAVNLGRVPERLGLYEELIQAAEPIFKLEGRNLGETIARHAQDLMFYDITLQECKTIEDAVRLKVEEVETECYKRYNEGGSRVLGQRDVVQYVKGDPRYVAACEVLLEVVHVKRRLEAIVEALKSMGWSLGHITKLRVAQLEHVTL